MLLHRTAGFVLAIALAAPGAIRVAGAATVSVPGDFETIQDAVDFASPGDSVLVGAGKWQASHQTLVACQNTVTLRTVVRMKPGIAILSSEGASTTILDAGAATPFLPVAVTMYNVDGAPALLEGFTITGGGDGIGVGCVSGTLTVRDCWILDNEANAVSVLQGSVRLEDCWVARNGVAATGAERAVYGSNAHFDFVRSRFEDNVPGAVWIQGSGSSLYVEDSEFFDHVGGRALIVQGVPEVLIRGSLFVRNSAAGSSQSGGAVSLAGTSAIIDFCTFAYDSSRASHGGALFVGSSASATITNNTFYGCHSLGLGAAVMVSGTAEVARNVIESSSGAALAAGPSASIVAGPSGCNVLWNETNYFEWPADASLTDTIADPLLCDPSGLDFRIDASSPAGDGGDPSCGFIGAHGYGCGGLAVDPMSWGKIKGSFR